MIALRNIRLSNVEKKPFVSFETQNWSVSMEHSMPVGILSFFGGKKHTLKSGYCG